MRDLPEGSPRKIGAFPPQGLRGCHSEARWPRRASSGHPRSYQITIYESWSRVIKKSHESLWNPMNSWPSKKKSRIPNPSFDRGTHSCWIRRGVERKCHDLTHAWPSALEIQSSKLSLWSPCEKMSAKKSKMQRLEDVGRHWGQEITETIRLQNLNDHMVARKSRAKCELLIHVDPLFAGKMYHQVYTHQKPPCLMGKPPWSNKPKSILVNPIRNPWEKVHLCLVKLALDKTTFSTWLHPHVSHSWRINSTVSPISDLKKSWWKKIPWFSRAIKKMLKKQPNPRFQGEIHEIPWVFHQCFHHGNAKQFIILPDQPLFPNPQPPPWPPWTDHPLDVTGPTQRSRGPEAGHGRDTPEKTTRSRARAAGSCWG